MFVLLVVACSAQEKITPPVYPAPAASLPVPVATAPQDGSVFQPREDLYSDTTAHKTGDVLTVLIQERHTVQENDDVNLQKKSELNVSANIEPKALLSQLSFLTDAIGKLQGSRESKHENKVKYEKKSYLTDRLAVVVTEVRPDGLLVVYGKRQITLPNETKTLALTGLVNAGDVMSDNSVSSDRIALSSIQVEGEGVLTATTEPGFAARTFQWIFDLVWPF
jgi:flagellar L-ring protein precursor FlgH